MAARLVAAGLTVFALSGCGASAGGLDGGGSGGGEEAGGKAGSSGGAAGTVAVDGGSAGSGGKIDGSSGGAGGAGGAADAGDACASLAGRTFISVDELPCNEGINPQAPPCNWSVTFTTAGGFSYAEAGGDLPITGTYVCAGGSITGTTTYTVPVLVFHGSYGGPGSELVWDNQRYH